MGQYLRFEQSTLSANSLDILYFFSWMITSCVWKNKTSRHRIIIMAKLFSSPETPASHIHGWYGHKVQQQQVGGQVPCSRTTRWWLLRDGGWNVTHTHHLHLQNQCEDLTPTAETDPPSVPSTHSSAGQHGWKHLTIFKEYFTVIDIHLKLKTVFFSFSYICTTEFCKKY